MSRETDPLWKALTVLDTDYSDYGGRVVRWQDPDEPDGDCSSGCRWARYLDGSGDWLVCNKPDGPRFGMLTWEHQAGRGCFEWACYLCGKGAEECECEDGLVKCDACETEAEEAEVKHASSKWHRFHRYRGGELLETRYLCPRCSGYVLKVAIARPEDTL
jgi:hypothetical protein